MNLKLWIFVPGIVVFIAGAAMLCGVRTNWTPSVPVGLYLIRSIKTPPSRGEFVAACLPPTVSKYALSRGYIGGGSCAGEAEPMLKIAAAVPGDVVDIRPGGIYVNGEFIAPPALPVDKQGRPVESIPDGRYDVHLGEIWMFANFVRRSFDSRYFGPIPIDSVYGTATPLVTYPSINR